MTDGERGIVWFRRDLRLSDHGILRRAVDACAEVVPDYPPPIVNHATERDEALRRFGRVSG